MPGRRVLLIVAVLAAAVPLAAGVAQPRKAHKAALPDFPTFLFAAVGSGHLRGNIAAVQRSRAPRADVFVSLHGLAASSEFRVTVTDVPCSRSANAADSILDLGVVGRTDALSDDFFARKSGRLRERLARGKSFRVYKGNGQLVCATANRVR